jgi:predicted PurR-regulated permease PerM
MLNRRVSISGRRSISPLEAIGSFALVAALLYFGAGIIVPLVLAILLAFALTPLVTWLNRRLHLSDTFAVILSVAAAILVLATLASVAGLQLARLAQELPRYQEVVLAKLETVQEQFGGSAILDRLNATIEAFGERMNVDAVEVGAVGRPVPVVISNEAAPLGLLTSVLGSIIGPVATVAIVTVFLIFLLLGRADLLDRFIRLVGSRDYARANIALADASTRVGRYLLVQLAVNCTYGLIFGLGLWLIGVPSAVLWGLLIVVFRYIPFIGALIIAIVPFALAFAVDPVWNMLILSVGLFLVLDLTTANVVEPRLYGSSTGVSPIAILLSAMFWATLWGPIGLILATPMTVCLVVIGRHLPQLQFLETLLGSEPVLLPQEQLYQRLLKGDTQGAMDIVEEFLLEHDNLALVEDVALPALRLATIELTDRPEALEQRRQLMTSLEMVFEELGDMEAPEGPAVLLVGGRTEFDAAAARLIALLLADEGISARVLPPLAIHPEAIGKLALGDVVSVTMVFLGSDIRAHARYVSRRLRRQHSDLPLLACAFGEPVDGESAERLHLQAIHRSAAEAVRSLAETWQQQDLSRSAPKRKRSKLEDALLTAALTEIAGEFGVQVAKINLLDDERHLAEEDAHQLTELVAGSGEPVILSAGMEDERLRRNAYLQANGIQFYVAVPLTLSSGETVGALALLGYEKQELPPDVLDRLQERARDLVRRFGDVVPQSATVGSLPGAVRGKVIRT